MLHKEVIIIDYGVGNVFSVKQAFEKIGVHAVITSDPEIIKEAKHLVLPGVGAFEKAMQALHDRRLTDVIKYVANRGKPVLGICLGMQMLLDESDEFGVTKGLGLIPGRVERFPMGQKDFPPVKIPQVNWHELALSTSNISWQDSLLNAQSLSDEVYFVHSFVAKPVDNEHVLAEYLCGGNRISAVIAKKNVMGCQFHPEKSGEVGLAILRNFMSV